MSYGWVAQTRAVLPVGSDGGATYETLGGVWNGSTHTFTVTPAAQATAGTQITLDLATTQRVNVGNRLDVGFIPTASSNSIGFTATATSGQTLTDLQNLLSQGQVVNGSWDFNLSGLPSGDNVMLSFAVPGALNTSDLTIWHYDQTTGWTQYNATDLYVANGWASFTVNSFSSYAVTGVPEPTTLSLLTLGGLLIVRRRRHR